MREPIKQTDPASRRRGCEAPAGEADIRKPSNAAWPKERGERKKEKKTKRDGFSPGGAQRADADRGADFFQNLRAEGGRLLDELPLSEPGGDRPGGCDDRSFHRPLFPGGRGENRPGYFPDRPRRPDGGAAREPDSPVRNGDHAVPYRFPARRAGAFGADRCGGPGGRDPAGEKAGFPSRAEGTAMTGKSESAEPPCPEPHSPG